MAPKTKIIAVCHSFSQTNMPSTDTWRTCTGNYAQNATKCGL